MVLDGYNIMYYICKYIKNIRGTFNLCKKMRSYNSYYNACSIRKCNFKFNKK